MTTPNGAQVLPAREATKHRRHHVVVTTASVPPSSACRPLALVATVTAAPTTG
jgi:hypothetical protein